MSNIKSNYKDKFYNSDLLFSHGLIYNFVLGARSNGKTYEAKKKVIRRFLRTGEQFIWLRRRGADIKDTFFSFPSDIEWEFPEHDIKVVSNRVEIDGKVAGWGLALNSSARLKSVSYSNVWLIVYDEFLVSDLERTNKVNGYLTGEVEQVFKLYDTVNRLKGTEMSNAKPVRMLFIANAESQYNPYFLYWDIKLDDNYEDGEILRVKTPDRGTVAVQRFVSDEIQAARRTSQFGDMISNTDYGRHSLDNEFYQDNDTFVVNKLPPNLVPVCNIKYDGQTVGFWYDKRDMQIYGSLKHQPTVDTYVFTVGDHMENTILLNDRGNRRLQSVLKAWRNGKLLFDSIVSKKATETLFLRI